MKVLPVLLLILLLLPRLAFAQDMLTEHRKGDPTAQLLEGKPLQQTTKDYANLYYDSCIKSGTDESMKEYQTEQCGCTAAKITEFMTLKDMKALFTKTKEGDFQESRVLLLAYIPCLYNSVQHFIYDQCYYTDMKQKKLRNGQKVCACYGREAGDYAASKGQHLIPGFVRNGYDSSKGVPNPMAAVLGDSYFADKTQSMFEQCVLTEEDNMDK